MRFITSLKAVTAVAVPLMLMPSVKAEAQFCLWSNGQAVYRQMTGTPDSATFSFQLPEAPVSQTADPSSVGGAIATSDEAVDLGLSVKWAPWNVGAKLPGEAGAYFAWGEVRGKKESYDWSSYWWMQTGKSSSQYITKYQRKDGSGDWYDSTGAFIGDGLTKLEAADDAAAVNWGGKWRMPTQAEMQELYNECTWTWKEQDEYATGSLPGYLITGPNGNSIFMPANGDGIRDNSNILLGENAKYWESELNSTGVGDVLFFSQGGASPTHSDPRYMGAGIRAVYSEASSSGGTEKGEKPGGTVPDKTEAVDLGLSVKWAPWNIGASNATDAGAYFAWGEVLANKSSYDEDSYKFYYNDSMTKYNSSDGLTTLEASDDAATVNWGDDWRMPTSEEFQELLDNCTWEWYAAGSLTGYFVTGSNGNSIFLPAAGNNYLSDVDNYGNDGTYWSSDLSSVIWGAYNGPYALRFTSDGKSAKFTNLRCNGFTLRPVLAKQ